MNIIASIIIGLIIGAGIAYNFLKKGIIRANKELILKSEREAKEIIKLANKDAESIKKEKILQAKEKFIELKSKHESLVTRGQKKINDAEKRIKEKEYKLNEELKINHKTKVHLERKAKECQNRLEVLKNKEGEVEEAYQQHVSSLERISGYSAEKAKEELVKALKEQARAKAQVFVRETMEEAQANARKEAQKIVLNTIQRIGVEHAVENSVSVFNIESDDIKGRIIGREGRNIRAIESATGVEIIVDDTPEAILLSCFDPVRREIARLSLHRLVSDGRIHPARVEEVVSKTKKQIEEEIIAVGKRTAIDLGIHGMHAELIKQVGRMKYRSSYGQNLLDVYKRQLKPVPAAGE